MNNPDAILNELAPAMPTEFGSHAVDRVAFLTCYSIYFRGEAYLDARQGIQAAAEFQKILDHPQLTLTDPVSAMATLGLARAYELSGDRAKVLPLIKTSRIFGKMPTRASRLIHEQRRNGKDSEFTKTAGHSGELVKSLAPLEFQQCESIPERESRFDHCGPLTSMGEAVSLPSPQK